MRSERAAGALREAPRGTLGIVVSAWLRSHGGGAQGRSVPSLLPPRARGAARLGSAAGTGPATGTDEVPAAGGPGRQTARPTRPCGCRQLPLKVTWGGGAAAAEAAGSRVSVGLLRQGSARLCREGSRRNTHPGSLLGPPRPLQLKSPPSGVVKASEEQPLNIAGPSCTWALHRQARG